MKIHIETDRLIIRDLEEFDADGMFALDSDSDVHSYLGNRPIKTVLEAKKIIEFIRNQYEENGIGRWAVIDKKTNEFIGWAGLKYEENLRKGFKYYDLGYRLRKKYWGMGIGTETAFESLKFGFNKLDLEEICAAVHTQNTASNRILKKVGLAPLETFEFDGAIHHWYKIRRSEWLELNPIA